MSWTDAEWAAQAEAANAISGGIGALYRVRDGVRVVLADVDAAEKSLSQAMAALKKLRRGLSTERE